MSNDDPDVPVSSSLDKEKYRGYEEYPWEGHSSNYGPLENKLGEGYGIGLGADLQHKYNAPVGSWVNVPPYGWRQVNETSAKDEGIELYTSKVGSVPDQLSIEGVSHTTPAGYQNAPGMDGKLHLSSGHALEPPYKPNYREGELYGADQAEAEVKADEAIKAYEDLQKENEDQAKESITKPDDSVLSPDNVVKRIRQNYPKAYDNVPDQKLYQAFKEQNPGGLQQMRSLYPEYGKASDKDFLKAVKSKYFPLDTEDEFQDRMNPGDILHNVTEQLPSAIPQFFESLGELLKFPERLKQDLVGVVKALGLDAPIKALGSHIESGGPAKIQAGEGKVIEVPPASPVEQKDIVTPLMQFAQSQIAHGKELEKNMRIPAPHDLSGQIAQKAARGVGALPEIAPSFMPIGGAATVGKLVVPHVAGLAIGMMYDAVQADAKAREAGIDKHMMLGAEGLSYRALQQWLLYTPRGKMLSGIFWALAGMSDQAAQNFIMGKGSTINDYLSTGAVNGIFGSIFSIGKNKMPGDAQDALSQAMEARAKGDYPNAGRLLDRTMLLLPDVERKAATNNLLAWRNQAIEARPGDKPLEMPGERGFLTIKGEPPSMGAALAQPEASALEMRTQGTVKETVREPEISDEERQRQLMRSAFTKKGEGTGESLVSPPRDVPQRTKSPADEVTDQFYYSGIDLRLIQKEFDRLTEEISKTPFGRYLQSVGKYGEEVRDVFTPEHVTPEREAAAAIIGKEIGKQQRDSQRMAQVFWARQKLEDQLRFAYESDQRHSFWMSRKTPELMTWFERHEANQSTGNPVADRMFQKHDELMGWLNKQEEAQGFRHGIRESYIYHALERTGDIDKLSNDIKKNGWGDPDFMHPRQIPTIEMVHALGYRLKTYNLEALDQMRIDAFLRAKMRANMLEGFRAAKLAFTDADFGDMAARALDDIHSRGGMVPEKEFNKRMNAFIDELKAQAERWTSPKKSSVDDKHETYWVLGNKKEGPSFMLHRATDPVDWGIAQPVLNASQAIKQRTTGLVLGWSAYHHLHMLPISAADSVTSALRKSIQGTANLKDWSLAIEDALTFGGMSHGRSLRSNQKLLGWYLNPDTTRISDLSPYEQKMFELQQAAGFVPQISHERQIQLARILLKGKAGSAADLALNTGYSIASFRPYQRWLFGRAIPSMKMYSFNRAAEALLEAHPDLNRPFNWIKRDIELRKIARAVDDRYGEQNLRQGFEHPRIKVLGQNLLLSYSWLKSAIDVYGGGVHDLWQVPKHLDEIIRSAEGRERYLTDRLVYMMTLTAITTLANMMIAQLIGVGVQSLTDLWYPNEGYGPDGKLKRIKPPFWTTTELGGLHHDIMKMGGYNYTGIPLGIELFFLNKMQPALSTIGDWLQNKDYFGNIIVRPSDPRKSWIDNWISQLNDTAQFILKNEMPFVFQQYMQPGSTPKDLLLGMAGLARAPKYAERSDIENEIVDTWVRAHAGEKDKEAQAQIDATHEFRQALLAKDYHAAQIARENLERLGVSQKSIEMTERKASLSEADRLFPNLTPSQQTRILQKFKDTPEFRHFLPMAHKGVQEAFHSYPVQ